jgi:hypothetical protein
MDLGVQAAGASRAGQQCEGDEGRQGGDQGEGKEALAPGVAAL